MKTSHRKAFDHRKVFDDIETALKVDHFEFQSHRLDA